tara:strand:+ start:1719 stop:2228 length:510 start_codon:yes stop_codon:yes gene_type:complete
MRFIKRQSTAVRNVAGTGVHVDLSDQVLLESNNVVLLPKGTTDQRPFYPNNGHMRYNTTTDEFEAFQNGMWRKLRFKEPNQNLGIKQQIFGGADGSETVFGPLDSGDTEYPVPAAAQNILVYIENVPQISGTNYSLVQNPAGKAEGWYISFGTAVPIGKPVTVIHNFDK